MLICVFTTVVYFYAYMFHPRYKLQNTFEQWSSYFVLWEPP